MQTKKNKKNKNKKNKKNGKRGKKGKRTIYKRAACCKVFVEYAKRVKNKGSQYIGTAITSKICMT